MLECYIFYLETGAIFLTSADQDIVFDNVQYLAVPIQREKYTSNSDSKIDDCQLHIDNCSDAFTAALYSGTDFRGCLCYIFQIAYPDALTDKTLVKAIAYGYLDAPILNQKEGTFDVTLKAQVPNLKNYRTFQLSCNAEYADQDSCMASLSTISGVAQAGTTASTIVLANSYQENYWYAGIITSGYESRMVESSSGNTVTLHYPFTVVPTNYTIEQGCDKSPSCCSMRGQLTNYSGFRAIPYELVIRSS